MTTATTVFHIADRDPQSVEGALERIFANEDRREVLRLEGTYSAVLERVTDPDLSAAYRYLILRPKEGSRWTTLLELGNRTEGLEAELSQTLDGAPIFALFAYGEDVSGYRFAREGQVRDRYVSDPDFLESLHTDEDEGEKPDEVLGLGSSEPLSGHPERFADLLPTGTAPDEFARVVLTPGYWETHGEARPAEAPTGADGTEPPAQSDGAEATEDEDTVDEIDRLRCIGLGIETWRSDSYPFAWDLEDVPNTEAGPAIVLAFA